MIQELQKAAGLDRNKVWSLRVWKNQLLMRSEKIRLPSWKIEVEFETLDIAIFVKNEQILDSRIKASFQKLEA